MDPQQLPRDPSPEFWQRAAHAFERTVELGGRENRKLPNGQRVAGTADTESQSLFGRIRFMPSRLRTTDPDFDYVAFDGRMEHSVHGFEHVRGTAIGYYANEMLLDIRLAGPGDFFDFAPRSTVGDISETFSLGLSLGAKVDQDGPGGNLGVEVGWSRTYSAPAVTIEPQRRTDSLRWFVRLPGDTFARGGDRPREPSITFVWEPQFIVRVPKGHPVLLDIHTRVEWNVLWPLGRVDDTRTWNETYRLVEGAYQVVNRDTGLVLDIANEDASEGASVIAYARRDLTRRPEDALHQLWYLDAYGHIVSALNGKVLDVKGGSTQEDAELVVWSRQRSDNQLWQHAHDGRLFSRLGAFVLGVEMQQGNSYGHLRLQPSGDKRAKSTWDWVSASGY